MIQKVNEKDQWDIPEIQVNVLISNEERACAARRDQYICVYSDEADFPFQWISSQSIRAHVEMDATDPDETPCLQSTEHL
jgi:hypothetical protein